MTADPSPPPALLPPPVLLLEDATIVSGDFCLPGIHLRVAPGEYVVLTGPSGVGKTTLLEAICGLRPITSGRLLLGGCEATRLPPPNRRVGLVPQDNALFVAMPVRENIAFALRVRGDSQAAIDSRTEELAGLLRLTPLLDRSVRGLSGGEAKRVALGRAMAAAPPVLLLDEPLAGLDGPLQQEVRAALADAAACSGAAVLHVTHDVSAVDGLATRSLALQPSGELCEMA